MRTTPQEVRRLGDVPDVLLSLPPGQSAFPPQTVTIRRVLDALSGPDLDLEVISLALTALRAGVLTPIWAVWTARSLP